MIYSDLVPLMLSHYGIQFEHDGEWATLLCPFHAEDSASLRINFQHGSWVCFGCGRKGRFYDFIFNMEQSDGMKALRVYKGLKRNAPSNPEIPAERAIPYTDEEPFDYVAAFSRFTKIDWALISKKHDAYRYFVRKRGLSPYTLSAFDCRLTGSDDYPVAIPIMREGVLTGYVKRYVGDDSEKKRYLYNRGMKAREAMAYHNFGNGPLLVVEGMLDYLKAAQFGAKAVAAILSWQIKQPQVDFLEGKGIDEVVCGLDNDGAGRDGCKRLAEFFGVRCFKYPEGAKDIADLSQNEFWYGYDSVEEEGEE